MNNTMAITAMARGMLLLMTAGLVAVMAPARAAEVAVTAEFKPSALDPGNTRFVNTTPVTGYCASQPAECALRGLFSISSGLTASNRLYDRTTQDMRFATYIAGNGQLRDVTVTSADGAVSRTLRVRLALLGAKVASLDYPTSDFNFWLGRPGLLGPTHGTCSTAGSGGGGSGSPGKLPYLYAWTLPAEPNVRCWRSLSNSGPTQSVARYEDVDVGFELFAPEPFTMPNGRYSGSVDYLVGAGRDVDMGQADYSDDVITLRFDLLVQHQFHLDVPPGADRVVLAPPGGWARWTEHGVAPRSLEQEIPFTLTTSGPISIKLVCQYPVGERCAIRRDGASDGLADVPVEIGVTLPGMRVIDGGAPAIGHELSSRSPAQGFAPSGLIINQPSRLHFAVDGEPLTQMLTHPGSQWNGQATIVFDVHP